MPYLRHYSKNMTNHKRLFLAKAGNDRAFRFVSVRAKNESAALHKLQRAGLAVLTIHQATRGQAMSARRDLFGQGGAQ